jgi:hypothetical protein
MFSALFGLGVFIIAVVLVAGVLRFITHIVWRIVSFVLGLVVILGAALIIMRFVQIH